MPLIDRDDVRLWDRWWLPAGAGTISFAVAISTATQGVALRPWQWVFAFFGLCVGMLDGFGSYQVISYGTLRGPQQREDEANARFFVWERARWRYALALLLSFATAAALPSTQSDEAGLSVVLGAMAIYFAMWVFDLVRSWREAKRLFPPGADPG